MALSPNGVTAVVYAEVLSVETDKGKPSVAYVTLDVKCKLAGVFDAAASPCSALRFTFRTAGRDSTRVTIPRPRRPTLCLSYHFQGGDTC